MNPTAEDGRGETQRHSRFGLARLLAIEAEAEVGYDNALVADIAGVRAVARAIHCEWDAYRAHSDGGDQFWMKVMDRLVISFLKLSRASRSEVDLGRGANRLGALVGEVINTYYRSTVPREVVTMGYLAKEIILDATACDVRAATTHVTSLRAVWLSLRTAREMSGAPDRAAGVGSALEALTLCIDRGDATQVADPAEAFLAEVYILEAALEN